MTRFETHMEALIEEYESECCDFSKSSCQKLLQLYLSHMEDSHLKCVLYKYLSYNTQSDLSLIESKLGDLKVTLNNCSSNLTLEEYDILHGDIEEIQRIVSEM